MKVLMVNKFYSPWIGGIETIVQQIAEGLRDRASVEVLCCQKAGSRSYDQVNGVPVTRAHSLGMIAHMPVSFDFLVQFWRKARSADIVALHTPFPLGDLALWLCRPKAKLIVHYHSDIVKQKLLARLLRPLLTYTLQKADAIVVSNPNLTTSSTFLQPYKEKCYAIPFGVDEQEIQSVNEKHVSLLQEQYGRFIVFAGRLTEYKGVPVLLEALASLPYRAVLIGSGNTKQMYERSISDSSKEKDITLIDHVPREEFLAYLKAARVCVLPSIYRSEAFGIVLLEAMALGTPVISTELGTGTSYVNQDGETGLVVPPGDVLSLQNALQKIMEDDTVYKKYSRAALKRVQVMFMLPMMLQKIEELYCSISMRKNNLNRLDNNT